jgi:hypothetical protein
MHAALQICPVAAGTMRLCQQTDHVDHAEKPAAVVPDTAYLRLSLLVQRVDYQVSLGFSSFLCV